MTTKTKSPNWYPGPVVPTEDSPTGFGTYLYDLNDPADYAEWVEAQQAANRARGIACGCAIEHEGRCGNPGAGESASPRKQGEQHEKSDAEKQALAEAIAYIREYRGNWGFILDLRADPKWNTKWFRLSDRQIEVILNAKQRDAARVTTISEEQTALVTKVVEAMAANPSRRPDFIISIAAQGAARPLSEKQTACLVRFLGESAPAAAAKAPVEVGEGWYMVDKTPFKVQHNLQHTGLYAKRLTEEGWEYVRGGLRLIAEKGERMTREAAAEYGRLYGVCGVCGRELTDETSIAAGIGPVCSGRLA